MTRVQLWLLGIGSAMTVAAIAVRQQAESAGRGQAQADRADWERGCDVPQRQPCIEFWQGGRREGTGFLIAESESAIAFFDVATHQVRQLQRTSGAITQRPRATGGKDV